MSTSATSLPAETIVAAIDGLIEGEALSAGARLTAIAHLATAASARGLNPEAPIDGDLLDTLIVDAIPSVLWLHA